MTSLARAPRAADLPLHGELRYGLELARLAADRAFLRPRQQAGALPVLLMPGFMAGDQSLGALRGWLRRRGSLTASAGLWLNIDCGERTVGAIEERLHRLAARAGHPVSSSARAAGVSWGACSPPAIQRRWAAS